MLKKLLLLFVMIVMAIPSAMADHHENPTIAIVRFGPLRPFELSEKGTVDMLEAYGLVNAEERAMLDERQDLEGEHINVIWGDAEFDFPTANQIIENVLDQEADVIIAITTPVGQAAANATVDMDNPPVVLFNTVTSPYAAGFATTSCIKPSHITGSQALSPYESIVPLILVQDPDVTVIGTIFNQAEANSVVSTEIIANVAEELGLTLELAPITTTADVATAAEGLISKGVQAFMIPTDSTVSDGLPALLAISEENGVPIYHADSSQVYAGATVGAGLSYYQEGVDTARMLIAYLNGELDIETAGISKQPGMAIAINMDSAALQGIEISDDMMAMADYVIEGEESTEADPVLPEMDIEDRMADDMEFLANLTCTDEIIAEQQAEHDAMSDD
jgi:putative tryptophan/tyrosine transport system substrate-binding protein